MAAVVLGFGLGMAAYARTLARADVRLDHYRIHLDAPGLPPAGVAVLHLSDFHFRGDSLLQRLKLARLRRLLDGVTYDILALTGDLIHDDAGIPPAIEFLTSLRPRLAAFSVPGNRDYWQSGFRALLMPPPGGPYPPVVRLRLIAGQVRKLARNFRRNQRTSLRLRPNDSGRLRAALLDAGIHSLLNAAEPVRVGAGELWIAGSDDLTQGSPDLPCAFAGVPQGAPLILLAHNPDILLDAAASRADLILAGHTHGGQVRVPLLGALYRQGTHLSRNRPDGWFRHGRTQLFVSRGLGESFPFRLGAPLQAALIRLLPTLSPSEGE